MTPVITVEQAIKYADEWTMGFDEYRQRDAWRLVPSVLAEEVKRLELIKQAAVELVDGDSWWDLKYKTGLPEERCKEILELLKGE